MEVDFQRRLEKPKPFIDIQGRLMLEHVISNVTPTDSEITVLLRQDHINSYRDIA